MQAVCSTTHPSGAGLPDSSIMTLPPWRAPAWGSWASFSPSVLTPTQHLTGDDVGVQPGRPRAWRSGHAPREPKLNAYALQHCTQRRPLLGLLPGRSRAWRSGRSTSACTCRRRQRRRPRGAWSKWVMRKRKEREQKRLHSGTGTRPHLRPSGPSPAAHVCGEQRHPHRLREVEVARAHSQRKVWEGKEETEGG